MIHVLDFFLGWRTCQYLGSVGHRTQEQACRVGLVLVQVEFNVSQYESWKGL